MACRWASDDLLIASDGFGWLPSAQIASARHGSPPLVAQSVQHGELRPHLLVEVLARTHLVKAELMDEVRPRSRISNLDGLPLARR